ncbi:malto-oligosyltrehalose synthase [Arthrobacter agilis]|uniref:malto-oligosyltrehalose synthase n=1 Tax=Arthrobacter agilis TaxID=37921 RepID=UPI000B360253|nr:malto-oligosyltrehalose synthase [Arthrobacter agilis]OUM41511.1 malto-oligosyltrehalose synthase [Arthrobacter agilis]PPB47321.1 malto-oligosyltrehalose synthase [Arthrobacter agilis]TPV26912.1 malto-oligosyltrehalose synthase [Arthrobacter agilis]VDR32961.1 Maltooligosyl trehalose synthase [Arthrobacter agilis]
MLTPTSTYRLQIRSEFDLQRAAALVPYLHDLGVDWVYLSPILTAEKGSGHGYDVTDPTAVDPDRGGPAGLAALSEAARAAGMGVLVDIVPNHMGIETPTDNAWWWQLLKEGRTSRMAEAFDVDWEANDGRIRVPVLGDGAGELDQLSVVDGELHYYDNRYPIADGTAHPGDTGAEVHERQHYELVNWRRADSELNYRRFFGVNSLAGLRVEVPWVFQESHSEVKRWFDEGLVDGLRIDHPDGLADPKGYLDDLRSLTGGAYVLVEKILEPGEKLPTDWATEGTTGYDALADIDRLFTDPAGEYALTATVPVDPFHEMIHGTKRGIADGILRSEVLRLARLVPTEAGLDAGAAADAIAELLTCFPVYRSYLPGGAEYLADAVRDAQVRRPDLEDTIAALHPLLNPFLEGDGEWTELAQRFQQTSGMVMAKGVEDTAFYRYSRLVSLNEVGADPSIFAIDPLELHRRLLERQTDAPLAMTTLSTHDTKRSEDTRTRISVISEVAEEWAGVLAQLEDLAPIKDPTFAPLLWQSLIGAWPLTRERAHAYAEKASREADLSTHWTAPDEEFERGLHAAVDAAFDDASVSALLTAFVERIRQAGWSNSIGLKLLQLTMPGVPDVYQGTEFWDTSLVDPDNRREVDYDARRQVLTDLNFGALPQLGEDAHAKLLVVSRALKLRRDRPELYTGYTAVVPSGEAADHVFGFDRGGAITIITRLPHGLSQRGGWGETTVELPAGRFTCALTGASVSGGTVRAADLFSTFPAALLVQEDAA